LVTKTAICCHLKREKNMRLVTTINGLFITAGAYLMSGAAFAQALETIGAPVPRGIDFQPAVTETARDLQFLDTMVNYIIGATVLLVTGLLIYVIFRFNAKANPKPSTFTHNAPLEVAWTIVPILVLVFIGSFSLPALFKSQEIPTADVTIKVTGNQWYWSYEYPGQDIAFDSFMLPREELAANGYAQSDYLLATDTAVVLPVNKVVVVDLTGADVIHGWLVPAFGVQHSAVPGRLGQLWFKAEKEGVYFGQCNALCGKDHAYMPIVVKIVSEEAYAKWLEGAKAGDLKLAAN
jgi:cytochrome c oxidase subunit 2